MNPLSEMSDLLGVEVRDVSRASEPRSDDLDLYGKRLRRGWSIHVEGCRGYSQLSSSDELRQPQRLNWWADQWGRDPALPRLTASDGRRLLRLLHEAVEMEEQK